MNVLITGASKGIGKAVARAFSMEEKICLILTARNVELLSTLENECRDINPDCDVHLVPFDITQLAVRKLPLPSKIDRIDVLINNAGSLINKPFNQLTNAEINLMTEVNFLAPFRLIQQLLEYLGGEAISHVVNISSMGGFQGSVKYPGLSVYSATKAALASLTECLAAEFSEKNMVFNCLCIGAVQTEMLEEAFPGYRAKLQPSEMAEYIKHFAMNAYKYMNGRIIPVSFSNP